MVIGLDPCNRTVMLGPSQTTSHHAASPSPLVLSIVSVTHARLTSTPVELGRYEDADGGGHRVARTRSGVVAPDVGLEVVRDRRGDDDRRERPRERVAPGAAHGRRVRAAAEPGDRDDARLGGVHPETLRQRGDPVSQPNQVQRAARQDDERARRAHAGARDQRRRRLRSLRRRKAMDRRRAVTAVAAVDDPVAGSVVDRSSVGLVVAPSGPTVVASGDDHADDDHGQQPGDGSDPSTPARPAKWQPTRQEVPAPAVAARRRSERPGARAAQALAPPSVARPMPHPSRSPAWDARRQRPACPSSGRRGRTRVGSASCHRRAGSVRCPPLPGRRYATVRSTACVVSRNLGWTICSISPRVMRTRSWMDGKDTWTAASLSPDSASFAARTSSRNRCNPTCTSRSVESSDDSAPSS